MSVWGKIFGGVAGFAIGGPLGGLVGLAAGHAFDKFRTETAPLEEGEALDGTRQVAFTVGIIVLSAKMAKADGHVTRDEIEAFKTIFHIPPEQSARVGKLFDQARKDADGFEPYARQIATLFDKSPALLEEIIGGLFHIAKADGVIHPNELEYLKKVAHIFGFSEEHFRQICSFHGASDQDDPYMVLGVPHDADNDNIKQAYRKLTRENHPDVLTAQGMPQEFIDLANEKMAAINAAYDVVRKQRGIK